MDRAGRPAGSGEKNACGDAPSRAGRRRLVVFGGWLHGFGPPPSGDSGAWIAGGAADDIRRAPADFQRRDLQSRRPPLGDGARRAPPRNSRERHGSPAQAVRGRGEPSPREVARDVCLRPARRSGGNHAACAGHLRDQTPLLCRSPRRPPFRVRASHHPCLGACGAACGRPCHRRLPPDGKRARTAHAGRRSPGVSSRLLCLLVSGPAPQDRSIPRTGFSLGVGGRHCAGGKSARGPAGLCSLPLGQRCAGRGLPERWH